MIELPHSLIHLLADETKAYAFLATLMDDGSPQFTPVWFNTDGNYIYINSARGRVKDKNMRARPKVAVTIQDPEDHYRYIQIRGLVVEVKEEGGRPHIDALSKKYTGQDRYSYGPLDEVRVIYKILPQHVQASG